MVATSVWRKNEKPMARRQRAIAVKVARPLFTVPGKQPSAQNAPGASRDDGNGHACRWGTQQKLRGASGLPSIAASSPSAHLLGLCHIIVRRITYLVVLAALGGPSKFPGNARAAASAQAITPAPLPQPDGMITQVRLGCGPGRTRVGGVCVARTTIRHTRRMARRAYRRGEF